jgi:alpha-L-rhamnosidase
MFQMLRLPVSMLAVLTIVAFVPVAVAQEAAPKARVPITQMQAVGDGKTLNTQAIQRTIDTVASSGGGTVVIPEGVFMSGSVFLKPGVNLHIEKNGVLKGTQDIKDYPKMETRIEGHFQQWIPALVNADKIDHLRITGDGTLDGSGQVYWDAFRNAARATRGTKNLDVDRPRMMFIRDSKDVQVSGIHFKDSGFWNLHLYRCDGVIVDGLDINAGAGSPSTDGVDVDSSRNVTIRNCTIANNDDCIALKGTKGPLAMEDKDSPPVEHIRIENCTFVRGGAFVTCGSEATIVRDVIVENCQTAEPGRVSAILRLKMRTDTPQLYEDIHVRNITLNGTGALIAIAPWSQYFDLQGHPQPTRAVRNVSLSNIKGTFGSFGNIAGGPGDTMEKITFENIDVKLNNTNSRFMPIKDLVMQNVKVNGEEFKAPTTAPTTRP